MENEEFLKLENESNIIDWEIEGIQIWRYERFMVHRYLHELDSKGFSDTKISQNYSNKSVKNYIRLFLKYRYRPDGKHQVFIFDHRRRVFDGQKYICKYTEELSDYYKDSITYEVPFNDSHLEPAKTENLRYYDRMLIKSYVNELFIRKLHKKRYQESYKVIYDKLKGLFGDSYEDETYSHLAKSMNKNLYLIKYREKQIRKLLLKIEPKVIVEVVSYSQNNMILNAVAAKLGIPTIELQHSQINDQMIQYMWGNRQDIEQFPQYLFTFGEFWSKGLQLPIPNDHIKAVGFPYFESEIVKASNKDKNEELSSDLLFISQYLAGPSVYELAIDYCEKFPETKIIYKLHPDEYTLWKERYPRLTEFNNLKVITDPTITLYDCFVNTKAVIGVFSGALYEALAFDLPVYLYNAEYIEYMNSLIEVKGAIVFQNANELHDCIVNGIKAQTPELEIWKTNALDNMIKEINALIDR